MADIVALENDHWQVGIVPAAGGSVAYGRVRVGERWVDVLRPTAEHELDIAAQTASYPLMPWSNRLRDAKFTWAGRDYQLRVSHGDGTAIHGTAMEYPWAVTEASATEATIEYVSKKVYGVNWPWNFTARTVFTLDGERFEVRMELVNEDHETFPAGMGHHTYFERFTSDGAPVRFQLNCNDVYPAVGCLPTGPAAPVEGRTDFRDMRELGEEFVDDCFTGRTSSTLATVEFPGQVLLDIEAGALLEHAVVYVPQGRDFFACEPVTNVNDGFNLEAAGAKGTGVFLMQPGETRSTAFTLVAQPLV